MLDALLSNGALAIFGIATILVAIIKLRSARVFIVERPVVLLFLIVVIFMTAFDLLMQHNLISTGQAVVLSRVFRLWFKVSVLVFSLRAIKWKNS